MICLRRRRGVSEDGCRPSRMAATMSGDRKVSRARGSSSRSLVVDGPAGCSSRCHAASARRNNAINSGSTLGCCDGRESNTSLRLRPRLSTLDAARMFGLALSNIENAQQFLYVCAAQGDADKDHSVMAAAQEQAANPARDAAAPDHLFTHTPVGRMICKTD